VIGVVGLLTVIVLRQDHAGAVAADASTLTVTGQALAAAWVIAPEVRPTTGERTEPGRRPLTHRHRPALTTSLGKNGLNTVVRQLLDQPPQLVRSALTPNSVAPAHPPNLEGKRQADASCRRADAAHHQPLSRPSERGSRARQQRPAAAPAHQRNTPWCGSWCEILDTRVKDLGRPKLRFRRSRGGAEGTRTPDPLTARKARGGPSATTSDNRPGPHLIGLHRPHHSTRVRTTTRTTTTARRTCAAGAANPLLGHLPPEIRAVAGSKITSRRRASEPPPARISRWNRSSRTASRASRRRGARGRAAPRRA
jgi:hypothetical protein